MCAFLKKLIGVVFATGKGYKVMKSISFEIIVVVIRYLYTFSVIPIK